jgi:hypothetical protein
MATDIARAACALAGFTWCCLASGPSWAAQRDGGAQPSAGTKQSGVHAASFDIVVKGGRLISGRRVLVVHRNDEVTLHITTDKADQFHLHGYNKLIDLAPDRTATLAFKATLTGRFTYELHGADLELGALEVYP